jgi:hypothetical protein
MWKKLVYFSEINTVIYSFKKFKQKKDNFVMNIGGFVAES